MHIAQQSAVAGNGFEISKLFFFSPENVQMVTFLGLFFILGLGFFPAFDLTNGKSSGVGGSSLCKKITIFEEQILQVPAFTKT